MKLIQFLYKHFKYVYATFENLINNFVTFTNYFKFILNVNKLVIHLTKHFIYLFYLICLLIRGHFVYLLNYTIYNNGFNYKFCTIVTHYYVVI